MGKASAAKMNRDPGILAPLDTATDRLLALIDGATREKNGGKFMDSWAEELGQGVSEWPW
jgi:hypothetical protein